MGVKEILEVKVMLYFMGKGLEEISKTDEEFQEEFEEVEGIVQWSVGEDITMYMEIEEGKITPHLDSKHEEPTVAFQVESLETAKKILSGEVDGTAAYMAGDLKMEGDMQMGMKMGPMAEFLQENLGDLLS